MNIYSVMQGSSQLFSLNLALHLTLTASVCLEVFGLCMLQCIYKQIMEYVYMHMLNNTCTCMSGVCV